MSYQFDTRELQAQARVKTSAEKATVRLLARRTARQARRATRAI